MNEQIINEVVKEVLIRIGHLKPMKLLKNADYDGHDLKKLEDNYGFRTLGQEEIWKDEHPLLIPRLTNRQLISIYNGNPCDLVTSCVIQGLLMGGKIYVYEKDIELLRTPIADTPFTKRYKEAYEILKASGLEIIEETSNDVHKAFSKTGQDEVQYKAESNNLTPAVTSGIAIDRPDSSNGQLSCQPSFIDKKVLGQKQVQSLIDSGKKNLILGSKQLVTPLAHDVLREAGIRIQVVDS